MCVLLTDECGVGADSSEDKETHFVGDDGGESYVDGSSNTHQNQTSLPKENWKG